MSRHQKYRQCVSLPFLSWQRFWSYSSTIGYPRLNTDSENSPVSLHAVQSSYILFSSLLVQIVLHNSVIAIPVPAWATAELQQVEDFYVIFESLGAHPKNHLVLNCNCSSLCMIPCAPGRSLGMPADVLYGMYLYVPCKKRSLMVLKISQSISISHKTGLALTLFLQTFCPQQIKSQSRFLFFSPVHCLGTWLILVTIPHD